MGVTPRLSIWPRNSSSENVVGPRAAAWSDSLAMTKAGAVSKRIGKGVVHWPVSTPATNAAAATAAAQRTRGRDGLRNVVDG